VFVWDYSKDLAADYTVGNKQFFLVAFCQKKYIILLLQNVYGTKGCRNMPSVTGRKDFIMQKCSVKKCLQAGKILQCRTAL
jgi:hypothetical protein